MLVSKASDLRPYLRSGNWDALKSSVSAMSVHEAHEAICLLAQHGGIRSSLIGLAASAEDSEGLAIEGGILRYRAWRIRGGLEAEMTPGEAMHKYQEVLGQALHSLDTVLAFNPRNPLACGFRSSISVEEDEDGKRAAIKRVLEANGDVAAGDLSVVLSAWTYKWGLSQDDMWNAFNRLRDPGRISTLALVPQAHWEQQTHYKWFAKRRDQARNYYRSEEVQRALAEASDEALDASPTTDPALLRHIDSWMARVFVDAGNTSRAKLHFRRLGRHVSDSIWGNGELGLTPVTRWRWARRRMGLWFD